nr:AbrB/MazE/SpoVT family DNA-binding domain-containing protein [uncultured Lichenicoccus sp.]
MFEDVDQYELAMGPDGQMVLPGLLAEKLGWRVGTRLLAEETDDGYLLTQIEVPGDVEGA